MTIFHFSQLGYIGAMIAMNYPVKIPKEPPFSELTGKYTLKLRPVYCQYCKYTVETALYGAKCGQCKSFLIEYLKSHFTDGLVNGNNRTA